MADDSAIDAPAGWRAWLRVHPAAEIFPAMSEEELKVLAGDIQKNGLRHPVAFIRDAAGPVLVDGRNRLAALGLLGRKIDVISTAVQRRSYHLRGLEFRSYGLRAARNGCVHKWVADLLTPSRAGQH
jgi:ParB-like nuclease domain